MDSKRVAGKRYHLGVSLDIDAWRRFLMGRPFAKNGPLTERLSLMTINELSPKPLCI